MTFHPWSTTAQANVASSRVKRFHLRDRIVHGNAFNSQSDQWANP